MTSFVDNARRNRSPDPSPDEGGERIDLAELKRLAEGDMQTVLDLIEALEFLRDKGDFGRPLVGRKNAGPVAASLRAFLAKLEAGDRLAEAARDVIRQVERPSSEWRNITIATEALATALQAYTGSQGHG